MTNQPTPPLVALIGYRGTGKSTVGQLLANHIGYTFFDSDPLVEEMAGRSIAEIFQEDGEETFRDLEEAVLVSLCQKKQTVLSLGGGAVLRPANRAVLLASGAAVCWLTASAQVLHQRITTDTTTASRRPSLTNLPAQAEIDLLLAKREPLYKECATFEVDTEDKKPETLAAVVFSLLTG